MSRLLVYNRETGSIEDRIFHDVIDYLEPGDVLVRNVTKVIPARLYAKREGTGGAMEFLLLRRVNETDWECLVKPGRKALPGREFIVNDELSVTVLECLEDGNRIVRLNYEGIFEEVLDRAGEMPLPPYITEKLEDRSRYQTVYARDNGSAAAPTAGLHFTPELLEAIRVKGVLIADVLLHVGLGTFRPVSAENVEDHHMHSEFWQITEEAAELINSARRAGGRIISVGTTGCRTLESAADDNGVVHAGSGWTDIFITPGYKFKAVDALITNFHLPESTLLMLISAFSSREEIMRVYKHAVDERYRFFSFGDAMLIV
jgi:S-adenosylmethionine:tRNA ribosyltransferase-isomerase